MRRQRNTAQMKDQIKSPEKELNKMIYLVKFTELGSVEQGYGSLVESLCPCFILVQG